jgi:hypothetical protein
MRFKTVYAEQPLPELHDTIGYVSVEVELADKLIKEGLVKEHLPVKAATYDTKVVKAKGLKAGQ